MLSSKAISKSHGKGEKEKRKRKRKKRTSFAMMEKANTSKPGLPQHTAAQRRTAQHNAAQRNIIPACFG